MPQFISLKSAPRAGSFQLTVASPAHRALRVALLSAGLIAAAAHVTPARADIWGYVDETGRAHMASDKLDSRYQLFFKGGKRVGGPASLSAPAEAAAVATPAGLADSAADAFRNSDKFRRTTAQTNVKKFEPLIEQAAKAHKVDPALVKAVVAVESSFQPDVVSPKGARGLMQVIPDTAERYGVVGDRKQSAEQKLLDPATNLKVGAQHLSMLMGMFASNLELVLAAYNAGEGAVLKYAKKIPPFRETQEYVKLVKQFYAGFSPTKKAEPAQQANPQQLATQLAAATQQSAMQIAWSMPKATAPTGTAGAVVVPTSLVSSAAYAPSETPSAATVAHPTTAGAAMPASAAVVGAAEAAAPAAATGDGAGAPLPVFRPIMPDTEPKPESVLAIG
jgi:soluble lytic murein transglycosylase-like protein